ncbi:MAG: hypothetical protein SPD56_08090 [Alloprevotella sp.]|nr:hypothetical protein [Alloprevotella sp.]
MAATEKVKAAQPIQPNQPTNLFFCPVATRNQTNPTNLSSTPGLKAIFTTTFRGDNPIHLPLIRNAQPSVCVVVGMCGTHPPQSIYFLLSTN